MNFIYLCQNIMLQVELRIQTIHQSLMKRIGVEYFFLLRTSEAYPDKQNESIQDDYRAFLERLGSVLREGVEINISLGEMGKRLIDSDIITDSLVYACKENGASITILHGPFVHPGTEKIFELGKQDILSLLHADHYMPHHFILVEDTKGCKIVADENPHNEGMWVLDNEGQIINIYRSLYRAWYILYDSNFYYEKLYKRFKKRKSVCTPTHHKPLPINNYRYHSLKVATGAATNAVDRYLQQPYDSIYGFLG